MATRSDQEVRQDIERLQKMTIKNPDGRGAYLGTGNGSGDFIRAGDIAKDLQELLVLRAIVRINKMVTDEPVVMEIK